MFLIQFFHNEIPWSWPWGKGWCQPNNEVHFYTKLVGWATNRKNLWNQTMILLYRSRILSILQCEEMLTRNNDDYWDNTFILWFSSDILKYIFDKKKIILTEYHGDIAISFRHQMFVEMNFNCQIWWFVDCRVYSLGKKKSPWKWQVRFLFIGSS